MIGALHRRLCSHVQIANHSLRSYLEAKLQTPAEGNLAEAEIARAETDQKENFPDGIKECGTDALRLTLLQYQQQVRIGFLASLFSKSASSKDHFSNAEQFAEAECRPLNPNECTPAPRQDLEIISRLLLKSCFVGELISMRQTKDDLSAACCLLLAACSLLLALPRMSQAPI